MKVVLGSLVWRAKMMAPAGTLIALVEEVFAGRLKGVLKLAGIFAARNERKLVSVVSANCHG